MNYPNMVSKVHVQQIVVIFYHKQIHY